MYLANVAEVEEWFSKVYPHGAVQGKVVTGILKMRSSCFAAEERVMCLIFYKGTYVC